MPLRDLFRGETLPSSGETFVFAFLFFFFGHRPCVSCFHCANKSWYKNNCGLNAADSLHLTQMLQLRRPRSPRQRVQVAPAAKEVPFLPEHWPHGCQLPNQSTAVLAGFSGKAVSLQRRRRRAWPPGGALRHLWLGGKREGMERQWKRRLIKLLWWKDGKLLSSSTRQGCFWNYLRFKQFFFFCLFLLMKKFFVCLWFGVTLRNTTVLLHSGRFF